VKLSDGVFRYNVGHVRNNVWHNVHVGSWSARRGERSRGCRHSCCNLVCLDGNALIQKVLLWGTYLVRDWSTPRRQDEAQTWLPVGSGGAPSKVASSPRDTLRHDATHNGTSRKKEASSASHTDFSQGLGDLKKTGCLRRFCDNNRLLRGHHCDIVRRTDGVCVRFRSHSLFLSKGRTRALNKQHGLDDDADDDESILLDYHPSHLVSNPTNRRCLATLAASLLCI
jgi:hypothetical protein